MTHNFEDMGILEMCRTLGDMGKEFKRDPLNDMSVKDYNLLKIQEKKDQLAGARRYLFEAMEQITAIEKELLDLVVEQVEGYKLPGEPK